MKKKIFIKILLIGLISIQLPIYNTFAIVNPFLENQKIYKPIEDSREELYQDIFCSLLMPYIQKSVSNHYKKYLTDIPTVDPWSINILCVERPKGYRTFLFMLKVEVNPYVGPHISVGTDQLTITIHGTGDVEVNDFQHIKDYDLPLHYEYIIKKN